MVSLRPKMYVYPTRQSSVADAQALVGVSILRSGGPFSYGLRRVIRDVQIGAMLIQSDPKTGEPLLLSSDLPQCVKCSDESKNVRVLLMDSQVS
jgi:uridine kinase